MDSILDVNFIIIIFLHGKWCVISSLRFEHVSRFQLHMIMAQTIILGVPMRAGPGKVGRVT